MVAKDYDAMTSEQTGTDDRNLTLAEEEAQIARAIASGDQSARSRLIEINLRLVVAIARDYLGRGLSLDDLIGEGNLGLIRATEEFDLRFGTPFKTYASYWIKQAIRHALINTSSTIRLPAHMVGLLTKWRRAERMLRRQTDRTPTFEEIAKALALSEAQKSLVAKALNARQLKLEGRIDEKDGRRSWEESVERNCSPESTLDTDDELEQLSRRMERLDDRERMVLSLRYGLEGEFPLTLREIGQRLGVTREWVRKIELRAVRKLDPERDQQQGCQGNGDQKHEDVEAFLDDWTSPAIARRGQNLPVRPQPDRKVLVDVPAPGQSPSAVVQANDRLAQLMSGLEPHEIEVIMLRRQGLKMDEISTRTGIHERNVRRIIDAARARWEARKYS